MLTKTGRAVIVGWLHLILDGDLLLGCTLAHSIRIDSGGRIRQSVLGSVVSALRRTWNKALRALFGSGVLGSSVALVRGGCKRKREVNKNRATSGRANEARQGWVHRDSPDSSRVGYMGRNTAASCRASAQELAAIHEDLESVQQHPATRGGKDELEIGTPSRNSANGKFAVGRVRSLWACKKKMTKIRA